MPSDWTTQVIVPFGAAAVGAVIGAGALLFTSRRQIRADAATVQQQFANERKEREREQTLEFVDLMIAAREEARINVKTLDETRVPMGRPLIGTEFLRQLHRAGRIIGNDVATLSVALVLAGQYNTAVEMQKAGVKSVAPQVMQHVADEVKTSMANSVSALSRLIEWTLKGVQDDSDKATTGPQDPLATR